MNRGIIFAVLLSLLVPMQLVAQEEAGCQARAFFDEIRMGSDTVTINDSVEVWPQLLFYRLDAAQIGDQILLEVRANGKRQLVEEIQLIEDPNPLESMAAAPEDPAKGVVVELLSVNPTQLADLHRLASAKVDLEVIIRLNGDQIDRQSFDRIVAASEALKQSLPQPRTISTRTSFPTPTHAPEKPSHGIDLSAKDYDPCVDQCEWEYQDCIESRCDYSWCSGCEDQYWMCLEYDCSICRVETSTDTDWELYSLEPLGSYECFKCSQHGIYAYWYVQTKRTYKKTVTTTTKNSDCTITVTSTVTYPYNFCWLFDNAVCGGIAKPCPVGSLC